MCPFPSAWENARANKNVKQSDKGSAKTRHDSFKILLPTSSGSVALFIFKVFTILKTSDDSSVSVGMLVLQKRGR